MATRALPDLVARIRVDSTGVDSAMTNLVGSFGRANLALAGVAAGIGILIAGGKSMIDISMAHDEATRGLAQAYASAGLQVSKYQGQIDDFIKTNRRYISDQSEVIDGYGKLTRSGLSQTEVQRAMNDAVDLAAIKHISLSDAVGLVDNAEHGRMRGLIDLGITTAKYTDAQGNLIVANHSVAKAMDELDVKLKDGRKSLSDYTQDTNALGNDWQDLANKYGPGLVKEMDRIVKAIEANMPTWASWLDKVVNVAAQLAAIPGLAANATGGGGDVGSPMRAGWTYIGRDVPPGKYSGAVRFDTLQQRYVMDTSNYTGPALPADSIVEPLTGQVINKNTGVVQRVGGGSVLPGGIYTVGEAGPETLVMGSSGGTVIPNRGGGGGITVNVHGSNLSPWQVANEIAWAKKTQRI